MRIIFLWIIFWELLDHLGNAWREHAVGRRTGVVVSGPFLCVSHLWNSVSVSVDVSAFQSGSSVPTMFL